MEAQYSKSLGSHSLVFLHIWFMRRKYVNRKEIEFSYNLDKSRVWEVSQIKAVNENESEITAKRKVRVYDNVVTITTSITV